MLDVRYLTRVPVAMLRHDLYVAEADRPWDEIPVMFQGFLIRTDEELQVLRAYCSFVYVEEARSRDGVFATLQQDLRADGAGDNQSPGQQDIAAAIGRQRHPDKNRLRERLASAADSRTAAGAFLSSAWDDARLGRTVNSRQARAVVEDLVSQVSGNTSASLWLTNLARKDDYSTAHSINVCVLALAFGMEQGLRGRRLENLGLGALLHDIGKVDQPGERLTRTGSLNRAEWQAMQRHPDDGAEKVAATGNIPGEVLDIIRMHHERIDGTGYPRGLRGGEIPETVRLVGLVNRYDSLTSDRPYRQGRPADDVLQDLYNDSAATYGAELVQAFIHCIGIFPIGSLVELDNGALGVVVGSSPENRLKPTVLLVRTPDGDYYQKRLLVNLAADPEPTGPSSQHIRRVVNPARYDIDVAGIVAFEFGVDF
ncbi:HD-GYP domain-containing protein [Aquisalimonas lutea]|uniref:HD-GYP domain-containing protein n=1 Tax=Aquisalimonas lutea TaxID=1327750 RepID=UPI0025B5AE7F|nr:HD-GYP domain-containing protein [Aquisalimonas lutea]MDN3518483.1 HD-GYP domain-containing protein [Aquisalimonas lutea]